MNVFIVNEFHMTESMKPERSVFSVWPETFASFRQAMDTIEERMSIILKENNMSNMALELAASGIIWYSAVDNEMIENRQSGLSISPVGEALFPRIYGLCIQTNTCFTITRASFTTSHGKVIPLKNVNKGTSDDDNAN